MRQSRVFVAFALALLAACGGQDESASVSEMGEHDHSQMSGQGGEVDSTGTLIRGPVRLTRQQEQALGVVITRVRRETLSRTIRTVGQIQAAEPNIAEVTPKIEGFVEELYVDFTGETVRRGQPLLTLYSPLLVAAQEELLTASRLVGRLDRQAGEAWENAQAMLEAARRRLAYWDITTEQIERIEATGEVSKTLTLVAPVSGIVLDKEVVAGQRVMPGMRLYRIADLRRVWVEGEVFEQDLQFVQEGSRTHIEVAAYPGVHLMGEVSFVYPTVDERSRTNRVRVTVNNSELRLKPGMYATVFFDAEIGSDVLTVPVDAVIVTGERNIVFVHLADGTLLPQEVVLGPRGGDRVVILQGLDEDEIVVASANFLVDAESRLATTGGSMPGMQHAGHGMAVEPDTSHAEHGHD